MKLAYALLVVGLSAFVGCSPSGASSGVTSADAGGDGASEASTVDPKAGFWHVRGGFIRDPDGRAMVMRGVNLSGAHKNPPYFGFHTLPDFQQISGPWGFNGIRLLTTWAALEPTEGAYDAAYLDQLAQRVEWAKQANLLVVVDIHQDVYGEGFVGGDGAPKWTCDASKYAAFKPATPWFLSYNDPNVIACYDGFWGSADLQSHYVEAARRLAARLASYDNVIGIDPMNEPYWASQGATFETAKLVPLYAQVMTAVRSVAPHWLAFAEPSAQHNLGLETTIDKFPFDDVVFAPHSYNSSAEGGTPFPASSYSVLVGVIQGFADEQARLGTAMWIGEYGGMANSGLPIYMKAEYDGAASIATGNMYWSDDRSTGGYGLLNDDGSEKALALDAVVRPYPMRVAGDPIDWSFDDTSSTFTFHYAPDRAVSAPTLISVPTRAFPNPAHVSCGGCTFSVAAGLVTISAPPPPASGADGGTLPATITITP
jgi:endoglycosylceramidase